MGFVRFFEIRGDTLFMSMKKVIYYSVNTIFIKKDPN